MANSRRGITLAKEQSAEAVAVIDRWVMADSTRAIAKMVAGAFIHVTKTSKLTRTNAAKEEVRKLLKRPECKLKFTAQERENGLKLGGVALSRAAEHIKKASEPAQPILTDQEIVDALVPDSPELITALAS